MTEHKDEPEEMSAEEFNNEQLREALSWAVDFISCNVKDADRYPDFHNAKALASGEDALTSGPFQMALAQVELLQREMERLSRWRRLLIECPKGAEFRPLRRDSLSAPMGHRSFLLCPPLRVSSKGLPAKRFPVSFVF